MNRRTYITDRDGEEEEKNPKVQMEPPAGGSGLGGNPKRKEPEQAGSVEGNGHVRLHTEETSSVIAKNERKKVATCSIPGI